MTEGRRERERERERDAADTAREYSEVHSLRGTRSSKRTHSSKSLAPMHKEKLSLPRGGGGGGGVCGAPAIKDCFGSVTCGPCDRSQVFTSSMRWPRAHLQAGQHRNVGLLAALLALAPSALVRADARLPALLAHFWGAGDLWSVTAQMSACGHLSHVGHVTRHRSLPAACAGPASSSRPAGIDVSASSRQSLHLLLRRWCWQMLAPPHPLYLLLWRWCWQMLAPALLACAPLALVLADRPPALLALAPNALKLADARAPALLACAPSTLVLADARPPALLASAP